MIEDPVGRIDYGEQGSGLTILFVPAGGVPGALWRGVIALLGEGFRTVTTSLLGYGDTEERRTPVDVSIEPEVDVIEAVIKRADGVIHLGRRRAEPCKLFLATTLINQPKVASLTLIWATPFNLLRRSGDLGLYEQVRAMGDAYARSFWLAARSVIDFYGGDGSFDAFQSGPGTT